MSCLGCIHPCLLTFPLHFFFQIPKNAFSAKLAPFGFNFFQMFVIDLMHEVELGGWRSLLIHLLRILQAAGPGLLHKLDERYIGQLVPVQSIDTHTLLQIQTNSNIWEGYNPEIFKQLF
jgi:hypothetical protein